MGDEDLRRLQREAARGDADAAARLARRDVRVGRSATWSLTATWDLGEAERASDALFGPEGADLLVVARKAVRVLDPATGRLRAEVTAGLLRAVRSAALWEGGGGAAGTGAVRVRSRPRLLVGELHVSASNAGGCSVLVSSLPPRSAPRALHEFGDDVDALAAGRDLAVAASGAQVRAWTAAGGVITWAHATPVRALAAAREGRRVLVVGDHGAEVRDLSAPDELARLAGGLRLVWTAALSSDGSLAVTATRDEVQVWEAATGVQLHALACPEPPVRRVSLSAGGVLAVAFADRVGFWHAGTGLSLGTTAGVGAPIVAAALDPTERTVVAVNPARLWTFRRSD